MTEDRIHHDPLDAVLAEYMRLVDSGDVDRDTFLQAHPDFADALEELFATEDTVLRWAGPLAEPTEAAQLAKPDDGNVSPSDRLVATQPLPISASGNESPHATNEETRALTAGSTGSPSPPNRTPDLADDSNGAAFGNYELLEILGRGGMGVVYRARQSGLERDVAVKMILNSHLASREDIERFYTEARAAANIRHENVVDIYEIGEVNSQHFFSMELVEGSDLSQMLREGRLESERAARLLEDIAEAVHAAHELGVLHRDLKPANILVDDQDRVVVTDFGLARDLEAEHQDRLTATGLAMGTPSYMSPEQARGHRDKVGRHSDVYSLGTVLFTMLTGQPPHKGETVMETLNAVVHQSAPHPAKLNADAAPALCRICLKCLEKDPQQRYPTAKHLADDLRRYLEGRPVSAEELSTTRFCMRWLGDVPILAALTGRHVHHPTRAHLRVQAALILATLFFAITFISLPRIRSAIHNRMPSRIRLAGGMQGGVYDQFMSSFADSLGKLHPKATSTRTTGSSDNRQALLNGEIELALLQESMVGNDELAIVAPVFDELVHLVVIRDRVASWGDLQGMKMLVGKKNSGMADAAAPLLPLAGATPVYEPFTNLNTLRKNASVVGAIVTIGRGSEVMAKLLDDSSLQLLEIPSKIVDALTEDPRYRRVVMNDAMGRSLTTVATPAFLACRRDAPTPLVRLALEQLYPPIYSHQMTRASAAHWTFMPMHSEARRFFEQPDSKETP